MGLVLVGDLIAPLPDLLVLGGLRVHPIFLNNIFFHTQMILNSGKLLGSQVGHGVIPPISA